MAVGFETKAVGDVVVLAPAGRLVIGEEVSALRDKIQELLGTGTRNILLNLSSVTYIDSTGVGAIVSGFTTVRRKGGHMKLFGLQDRVRDILVVTKLLTVFDVFKNEEEGVKSFS